jgi:hypothetical protein
MSEFYCFSGFCCCCDLFVTVSSGGFGSAVFGRFKTIGVLS